MESPLLVKSKQFALDIIKVCNKVKSEKRESVLTNQLVRSGVKWGRACFYTFYSVWGLAFFGIFFVTQKLSFNSGKKEIKNK